MELSVIFYHENEALKKRSSVIRIFFRLRRAQTNTISFIQSYQKLWQFCNRLLSMSCNSGAMDGSDTVREMRICDLVLACPAMPTPNFCSTKCLNIKPWRIRGPTNTWEKTAVKQKRKRFQAIQLSCRSEPLDMSCIWCSHGAYWHTCSVQYSNSLK